MRPSDIYMIKTQGDNVTFSVAQENQSQYKPTKFTMNRADFERFCKLWELFLFCTEEQNQ